MRTNTSRMTPRSPQVRSRTHHFPKPSPAPLYLGGWQRRPPRHDDRNPSILAPLPLALILPIHHQFAALRWPPQPWVQSSWPARSPASREPSEELTTATFWSGRAPRDPVRTATAGPPRRGLLLSGPGPRPAPRAPLPRTPPPRAPRRGLAAAPASPRWRPALAAGLLFSRPAGRRTGAWVPRARTLILSTPASNLSCSTRRCRALALAPEDMAAALGSEGCWARPGGEEPPAPSAGTAPGRGSSCARPAAPAHPAPSR